MSSVKVSATSSFVEFCDVACSILTHVRLKFSQGGVSIKQLDKACVCFVQAEFPLETYFNENSESDVTVDAKKLTTVLRQAAMDDVLDLSFGDEEPLVVTLTSTSRTQKWSIATDDLALAPPVTMKNLGFDFSVAVKVTCLFSFVNTSRKLEGGADVKVEVLKTDTQFFFVLSTVDDDDDDGDSEPDGIAVYRSVRSASGARITKEDLLQVQTPLDPKGATRAYSGVFDRAYLRKILRPMKKARFLTLSMSPSKPMVMHYTTGSAHIRFMLASKYLTEPESESEPTAK
jgi:hypothetical protein